MVARNVGVARDVEYFRSLPSRASDSLDRALYGAAMKLLLSFDVVIDGDRVTGTFDTMNCGDVSESGFGTCHSLAMFRQTTRNFRDDSSL